MPRLKVSLFEGQPLFDVASYARGGPGRRDRLSPGQLAQISRTVRRAPEAVVKVLPRDANNFSSVGRHLGYIGRYGELAVEDDDGHSRQGKGIGRALMEDWDLDLDEHRRQSDLAAVGGRRPPKLVHKLMLSMPAGTPPQAVLAAARNFLREEFALRHRYAFVLHTDEPHPHVHAVVKAVSEKGVRLHIRKATLREWRREFARHLRAQGVEANATERAVRGESRTHKIDGIYRPMRDPKRYSTHILKKTQSVAADMLRGGIRADPDKATLLETRKEVERGWQAVSNILIAQSQPELAADVRRFVDHMSPVQTEREAIAEALRARTHGPRVPQQQPIR